MSGRVGMMAAMLVACAGTVSAQVVLDMVTIRNPGNLGEFSGQDVYMYGNQQGVGETRVCGAVNYVYEICKFEVTAAQYVEFLNAVAADDPYGLYNTFAHPPGEPNTTSILRSGSGGSYTYSVAADWADRPVAGIGWADACRFANWMHNGQPTGPQGPATTEDGAYTLNGATTNPQLQNVVRNPGAVWALPTEDEWYKAAYHKNNGTSGSYWDFATRADFDFFAGGGPRNDVLDPDPGNSACFWIPFNDQCIGPPYFRTVVGEFENSASEYGTFDQNGNVWEWTESRPSVSGIVTSKRVMRGGSFYNLEGMEYMNAAWRSSEFTAAQLQRYGFRLVRPLKDCNTNGTPDQDEILAGTAHDYNFNGLPDECDIAAGTSQDCNGNGVPDEVDVGAVSPMVYQWDDGTRDDSLGIGPLVLGLPDGWMTWINGFSVQPARETISAVSVSFGLVAAGTPATVYLWGDPDGDGDPSDAVLLASAATTVAHPNSNVMNVVELPDTYVGPVGTTFFVGIQLYAAVSESLPANIDFSGTLSDSWDDSWIVFSNDTQNPVDPNDLASAWYFSSTSVTDYPGNWTIRALPASPVTLKKDMNQNGIPDSCEGLCPSDFDANGFVNGDDFDGFMLAFFFGDPNADFDDNSFVNGDDFDAFTAAFDAGC